MVRGRVLHPDLGSLLELVVELGGKQSSNLAPDILEHVNEGEARIDACVLPITRDRAGLPFVATLSETCWEDGLITGPRTFLCCTRFILTHYTSREARHSRCLVETRVDPFSKWCQRAQGNHACHGALLMLRQTRESACLELVARQTQMIELKYTDRVLPKPTKDMDPFNDSHLYSGTSETRGSLMVCAALENILGISCILNLLLRRDGVRLRRSGQAPGRRHDSALGCEGGSGIKRNTLLRCWKRTSRPTETRCGTRSSWRWVSFIATSP